MRTLIHCSRLLVLQVLLLALGCGQQTFGGTYGEHKRIGDRAFKQAIEAIADSSIWSSSLSSFVHRDSLRDGTLVHWFLKLRGADRESMYVTYGDLCALSGDHSESPLRLYEELMDDFSPLRGIVLEQHRSLDQYAAGAPDVQIALEDPTFIGMVVSDKSHFYDYTKDFVDHLAAFDARLLDSLIAFSKSIYTKELYNVTSLKKYLTIHSFAIHTAQTAALRRSPDILRLALYISAYADHFIQDAFASGHRVVHRTYLGSFTNNKFMHDLFGEKGLEAVNMQGRRWLSYGDAKYNKNPWSGLEGASQPLSENMQIAVQCCSVSVSDVLAAFTGTIPRVENTGITSSGETIRDTLDRLAGSPYQIYRHFLRRFGALRLIPIPFEHSGTSVANEEDETLRQAGIERFDAKMTAPTREATLNAVAFQTLGGSRRIRELDAMPEKTGPAKLVRAVDYHKGIGISLIHSSFGGRYDLAKNVSYALGYSISVKGLANNFGYDNTTFDHLGCFDWWMDISFTNLFVRHDHLSGNEFKFGMNHCFDFYSHNDLIVELGVLGEFGWYRLGETKFRAEPSAELGIFPHQTGLKILARWLLAPDLHSLDLGVAWDATRVLDGVVDLVDRLLLGI